MFSRVEWVEEGEWEEDGRVVRGGDAGEGKLE